MASTSGRKYFGGGTLLSYFTDQLHVIAAEFHSFLALLDSMTKNREKLGRHKFVLIQRSRHWNAHKWNYHSDAINIKSCYFSASSEISLFRNISRWIFSSTKSEVSRAAIKEKSSNLMRNTFSGLYLSFISSLREFFNPETLSVLLLTLQIIYYVSSLIIQFFWTHWQQ